MVCRLFEKEIHLILPEFHTGQKLIIEVIRDMLENHLEFLLITTLIFKKKKMNVVILTRFVLIFYSIKSLVIKYLNFIHFLLVFHNRINSAHIILVIKLYF